MTKMDSRMLEQIEPLNKRHAMNNSHDHITKDGTIKTSLDRKDWSGYRNSGSVSSYKSRHSRSNRARERQTPRERCVSNLVIFLQCYNVFILILGCAVLGIGIWLMVKEFNTREMSAIMGSRLLEFISYGLLAGGGAATLLAFCGCCGTMRQEKFVLGFYGVVLTLVLLTLCVGFGVSFIFRDELEEGIKNRFETTVIKHYGVDVRNNTTNRLITDAWDSMQQALECCGAHGDVNGVFSWGVYKQQSVWHKKYKPKGKMHVPNSCCVDPKSVYECQGMDDSYDGPPVYGPPNSEYHKHKDNPYMYTTGCYDKAMAYLEQHFLIVIIVTGTVPLLLLIGIVVAFYLCANVKDTDDDYDFAEEVEV